MSDINSYIWKDARLTHDKSEKQVETRLIDMDEDQLQMVYSHCKDMLFNTDPKNAGRLIIIDQIAKQMNYCMAELILRFEKSRLDNEGNPIYPDNASYLQDIKSWINNKDYNPEIKYTMQNFTQEIPEEYKKTSLSAVIDACKDNLGLFDHSKITYTFIYQLGLYLTQEELKEIDDDLKKAGIDPKDITLQEKIDNHIKVPLGLSNVEIKINPRGLTKSEFRDMINMKHLKGYKSCKYSALTTSQLQTLSNKVLKVLKYRTMKQAEKWQELMVQIEEVADYKHIKLK